MTHAAGGKGAGILCYVDREEAAIQIYHQIEGAEVPIGQTSKAVMRVHLNATLVVAARNFRDTPTGRDDATA